MLGTKQYRRLQLKWLELSPNCTKVANLSYKVRNEGIWTPVHNLHFRIVVRDLGLKGLKLLFQKRI